MATEEGKALVTLKQDVSASIMGEIVKDLTKVAKHDLDLRNSLLEKIRRYGSSRELVGIYAVKLLDEDVVNTMIITHECISGG